MSEEIKNETKQVADIAIVPPNVNDDIFITEKDTFDCSIRYYKNENGIMVEKVDDEFDNGAQNIKTITFTCKHPNQSDYQTMLNSPVYKGITENITGIDLAKLEITRLSLLIRKWSVQQSLDRLLEVDPKIVKAMLISVNEQIGLKAIF